MNRRTSLQIMVGMLLPLVLVGCAPASSSSSPPQASTEISAGVATISSRPTLASRKVSSYEECLVSLGSLLLEGYDPPVCVTKDGKTFRQIRVAASATLMPTSIPEPPTATGAAPTLLDKRGPWLLYVHNFPSLGMYDVPDVEPEFILVNQDGSGRTPVTGLSCYNGELDRYLSDRPQADRYLAGYDPGLYLFQPSEAVGLLVYESRPFPTCQTFFNGSKEAGLLASIHQAADIDIAPELIIYELPGGEVRDRLPLAKCTQDGTACAEASILWREMVGQKARWSPNGRYLAFAALLDATSTDLFVYDSQNGSVRRLTHGPDWVGPVEWSPDGTQIVMQEILNEDVLNQGPAWAIPSSVWSVSVSTNEIKLLYRTGPAYMEQEILQWLDDRRFLAYEGSPDPTNGWRLPRFVDIAAGTSRILLDDWFVSAYLDPVHETLAIFKQPTEKTAEGTLLVSVKDGTLHRLHEPPYVPDFHWDTETGLFVSIAGCQDDPQRLQAFDYRGNFSCVPKPTSTPAEITRYPSPNGKWTVSLKNGLWLETEAGLAVPVSPETASEVIWCPDSSCFFFSALQPDHKQTLYHVSLSDLAIITVDEGIQSMGSYQWLGGEIK